MSFDGIFTYGMTNELQETLTGGRISKIHQPYKHELIFHIRSNGKNHKLLLSAHPSYARVQLTEHHYDNPSEPPMFCMLLRKHLESGFIERFEQVGFDRVIVLHVRSRNEIGDEQTRKLYIEIMGRHSNLILVEDETQQIIDGLKHLSPSVNSYRTVLPGHEYLLPPAQQKLNPFLVTKDDILKHLRFQEGKSRVKLSIHSLGCPRCLQRKLFTEPVLPIRKRFQIHCLTCSSSFGRILLPRSSPEKTAKSISIY